MIGRPDSATGDAEISAGIGHWIRAPDFRVASALYELGNTCVVSSVLILSYNRVLCILVAQGFHGRQSMMAVHGMLWQSMIHHRIFFYGPDRNLSRPTGYRHRCPQMAVLRHSQPLATSH